MNHIKLRWNSRFMSRTKGVSRHYAYHAIMPRTTFKPSSRLFWCFTNQPQKRSSKAMSLCTTFMPSMPIILLFHESRPEKRANNAIRLTTGGASYQDSDDCPVIQMTVLWFRWLSCEVCDYFFGYHHYWRGASSVVIYSLYGLWGFNMGSAIPSGWRSVKAVINTLARILSRFIGIVLINYIFRSTVITITSSI